MKNHIGQDFFLNLGVTVTLYASIVSFLSLIFSIVNKVFPDVLASTYYYGDPYSGGVRTAMACLIVVFPLFLWLSRTVGKSIEELPARRDFIIRRWLVYITVFLASAALVVDLITLLTTFLSGEITTRFILKAVAVLVVTGVVFWYYLAEARNQSVSSKYKAIAIVSTVLVVASLVTAFAVFGSPTTVRKLRADNLRVSHLQSIQWQIINHYQQKGALPETIGAAQDPLSSYLTLNDPETGKPYVYEPTGKLSFKLCADFLLDSQDADPKYGAYMTSGMDASISARYPGDGANDIWKHGPGTVCFDRTIDPDFYPVYEKPVVR